MDQEDRSHEGRVNVMKAVRDALKQLSRPNQPLGYRALLLRTVQMHFFPVGNPTNDQLARTADAATRETFPGYAFGLHFSSICSELLTLRYIQPKPDTHHLDFDNFVVTALGEQWLSPQEPIPEDADGYIRVLEQGAPDVDGVILQYIREALVTYERGALFASAVMVGAASEKAMYLLVDALSAATNGVVERKALEKTIAERSLPKIYRTIDDHLVRAKKAGMPYSVHEGADRHLLSLQDSIRVQRNDAVHPQIGQVTRESLRLALLAFPFALKKVYALIGWLKSNAI